MPGYLLLEGGAEFGGMMEEPDRKALALAGGPDALVYILPTAAAPDHNEARAGGNGTRWFKGLGARRVEIVSVIDRASADLPANADLLRAAKMIYLLGGFTHYLGKTLAGSAAWEGTLAAYKSGAVIAGSSAGAMVLCDVYFNPESGKTEQGLGLVADACVLPHHNNFGKQWAGRVRAMLPGAVLIGIDEQTGMIDDGESLDTMNPARRWTVYGRGAVTLYRPDGKVEIFQRGESFIL
jgi:cyanophycinase